jgi:hypothetical protein
MKAKGGEKISKDQSSEGSSDRCAQCGQVRPSNEPVYLRERDIFIGPLTEVAEPDGEDFLLARIAGELLELPMELSAQLRALVGLRVIVGKIAGQYRAGVSTQ